LEPQKKIHKSWKDSQAVKFLSSKRESHGIETIPVLINKDTSLKTRPDWLSSPQKTWFVASVSSCLLPVQLAVFLGCKRILLIGADFGSYNGINYAWEAGKKKQNKELGYEVSYKYDDSKSRMVLKRLSECVNDKLNKLGVEVVNASYGDLLDFEKIPIRDITKWLKK
jgi:hypothetical protein